MTIIEGIPDYTDEECAAFTEALKADPVIVAMYDEIFDEDKLILATDGYSEAAEYLLALVSATEYEDRGGVLPSHLGGPLDAIKALAKEAAATS